jgi:hypothetical protein
MYGESGSAGSWSYYLDDGQSLTYLNDQEVGDGKEDMDEGEEKEKHKVEEDVEVDEKENETDEKVVLAKKKKEIKSKKTVKKKILKHDEDDIPRILIHTAHKKICIQKAFSMSKIDLFSKPFVSRVFFFLLKRFF